jgi:lysophospholipase L1-like esterase
MMARYLLRPIGFCALVGGSVLLTLASFELGLRWLGYEAIYQVYSHPEIFWQRDELLGWSHEPNAQGTYVGPRPWPVEFEALVEINSLGLRGPEIAELPANGYRVLFLGDSLVAGFEVPYEESFEALLEAELGRMFDFPVQVINGGVRGYGTDQSYLYYRERGRRLRPDLVVFVHGGNDAADNITLHRMRRTFSKGALAPRVDGSLEGVGYPIPEYPLCSEYALDASLAPRRIDTAFESAMCNVQTRMADRSALFTFFSERIRRNPAALLFLYRLGTPDAAAEIPPSTIGEGGPVAASQAPQPLAARYQVTRAILHALAREVRVNGAELLLPVVPDYWRPLDASDLAGDGVFLLDVVLDLARPELHFQMDSHLNARGHAAFARLLAPAVAERIRAARSRADLGAGD